MWREHSTQVKRKKRSVGNITIVEDDNLDNDEEGFAENLSDSKENSKTNSNNSSFSESLKLFQSIQVLANEEAAAYKNETTQRVLVEAADYCFSSLMFTSVVGVITVLLLMSGLTISLLCARLKRSNKESKESAADVVHNTLRLKNYIN